MKNEKKLWLLEQYAYKAWTVSLTLAQEAARAGEHGRGYAVVSHEARVFADKLLEFTAKEKFDGNGSLDFNHLLDFGRMLVVLSINAELEAQSMAEVSMDFNIPKTMAAFAVELRRIAAALYELGESNAWDKPFTIPEFKSPSESAARDYFLLFSIGGLPLIENLKNVLEVCCSPGDDTIKNTFTLRGVQIPLINCFNKFNIPNKVNTENSQTILIVNGSDKEMYAVLIDDLDFNAIFYSAISKSVPVKKENPFSDFSRECWDTVGGEQVVFADWKNLAV